MDVYPNTRKHEEAKAFADVCATQNPDFSLPIEEFKTWYEDIKNNRAREVGNRLTAAGNTLLGRLLNGHFQYKHDFGLIQERLNPLQPRFLVTTPCCLAAVFGAKECVTLLLQYGAQVTNAGVNGMWKLSVCRIVASLCVMLLPQI